MQQAKAVELEHAFAVARADAIAVDFAVVKDGSVEMAVQDYAFDMHYFLASAVDSHTDLNVGNKPVDKLGCCSDSGLLTWIPGDKPEQRLAH